MKPPLPPGVRLARDQSTAPVSRPDSIGAGHFIARAPELAGIPCQILHPMKPGDAPEPHMGLLGCGVIITPTGPVFMLQAKHADGTSLMALLEVRDFVDFGELWAALPEQAQAAMRKPQGRG